MTQTGASPLTSISMCRLKHDLNLAIPLTLAHGPCVCPQVRQLADDFYREAERYYYATPTSYLELIQTYKELLGTKRKAVRVTPCTFIVCLRGCACVCTGSRLPQLLNVG